MPQPSTAYVILRHVLSDGEHWDLMLDRGEALATWQLALDPVVLSEPCCRDAIPVRRIGDHRRAYLVYEGPISGGRGHVSRVDRGFYELTALAEPSWTFRLEGSLLRGRFAIQPKGPGGAMVLLRVG